MKTTTRHIATDAQMVYAGGSTIAVDQKINDAHRRVVHGETLASGHLLLDTQDRAAACESSEPASHTTSDAQGVAAGGFGELRAWARLLDDVEHVRVSCALRISALERGGTIPDQALTQSHDDLKHVERVLTRQVERAYKTTRFHAFTKPIPGIGDKLMGRLIAETGDPATRPNPAKYLAYCGCGDPTLKRRRKMTQEDAFKCGSPKAKAIILSPTGLAAQIVMHRAEPYRTIYDQRKARYIDAHPDDKEWPLMHCEKAARKVAVKRFLIDLWEYARDTATDET